MNRDAPEGEVQGVQRAPSAEASTTRHACTLYVPLCTYSREVQGVVASVCVKHTSVNAEHTSAR